VGQLHAVRRVEINSIAEGAGPLALSRISRIEWKVAAAEYPLIGAALPRQATTIAKRSFRKFSIGQASLWNTYKVALRLNSKTHAFKGTWTAQIGSVLRFRSRKT